jgi:hypothetical protein
MMTRQPHRRSFLRTALGGSALLGLGGRLTLLDRLPAVADDQAGLDPARVRLDRHIEPEVRLLEETPRERLLEAVADRIRGGLNYRDLLAALLLAGVRNIQPRPSVGFKFHAVLVVNSAHIASLASPASERWLPIFWSLDYFKDAQAQDELQGAWTMGPVDEQAVPPAHRAREAFVDAMDRWDEPAADAAVAALARSAGSHEVFELFYRFGARDFRSIGHKAIFVANAERTLGAIGWHHAEPVLRSLAYALLMHERRNPAQHDLAPDRPWRENLERARRIRDDWQHATADRQTDAAATAELLDTLRTSPVGEACDLAVEVLNRGVGPQTVWDAAFAGAAEVLLRQPGVVALHAMTSANALHYAYRHSGDDMTRRLMLLQGVAFAPLFLDALRVRGLVAPRQIEAIGEAVDPGEPAPDLDEVFAEVRRDRHRAAAKAVHYLKSGGRPEDLIDAARRLVFLKGRNSHDYKFSSAVLEDYYHIAPAWRDRYLATGFMYFRGSTEPDNALVERTRAALSDAGR